MKKIFLVLLSFCVIVGLASCENNTDDPLTCDPNDSDPVIVEVEKDLTPSPTIEGIVHHWMLGAMGANVTANIDLKKADTNSLMITFGSKVLESGIDYDVESGKLTIYGDILDKLNLKMGANNFTVVTNHGSTNFAVTVVDDPTGTTIATKDHYIMDMGAVPSYKPTAVIANAPKILITEIGVDAAEYGYIEVFNNSTAELNLKGKRIVFGDLTKQTLHNQANNWLVEQPFAMTGGIYIYQDYIVPALSSAIVWIVTSTTPWSVAGSGTPRQVSEESNALDYLVKELNGGRGNLSIAKFKDYHGLNDSDLVFPVRMQYMLMNGENNYDATTGYGTILAKATTNIVTGFNSSVTDRIIQIQDIDQTTKYPAAADIYAPAGSTYYRYEMNVLNREEDVYKNGTLDRSVIVACGGRESINGVYLRKVYYNSSDEKLGYSTATAANTVNIDLYNANKANTLTAQKECFTAIVSAIIHPQIVTTDGTPKAAKWGVKNGVEYTIPASADSIMMRFIMRSETNPYETFYATTDNLRDIKLSSIAAAVTETLLSTAVQVPVDGAYPTDYLSKYKTNTAGKTCWFNFGLTKPA